MAVNYTLQDIAGTLLAFVLFPLVFVFPGYVIGWALDLFEFRKRLPSVQFVMGIALSNALSPILLFLAYRLGTPRLALLCVFAFAATGLTLLAASFRVKRPAPAPELRRYQRLAIGMSVLWMAFIVLLLVDIQVGDRLYFSGASYDLTTRVAVVDAITRTGVPPVNPGYYPGHPVPLTFLYYFWYILASVIDAAGGIYVTAYHAMIASIAWCGIALAATLAVYLRLRSHQTSAQIWRRSLLAAQFIAVGGLDFPIVLALLVEFKLIFNVLPFQGRIEGWNMPIMSWMNALAWVPHHLAGALACLTGMMIFIHYRAADLKRQIIAWTLVGLCFASAFGLSVWTLFVFGIFWLVWAVYRLIREQDRRALWGMAAAGFLALVFILPFLLDIAGGSIAGTGKSGFPIAFYVRPFTVSAFLDSWPPRVVDLVSLFFLPVSYLIELGVYFLVGAIWMQRLRAGYFRDNPYQVPELLLIITSLVVLSFVASRLIAINDLGIRGWLPMQVILIVWATDLVSSRKQVQPLSLSSFPQSIGESGRTRAIIALMLITGLLTTAMEVVTVRTWPMLVDLGVVGFPNELSPDTDLGRRTYDARRAYDFVHESVPAALVIQNNPETVLDRPAGLYGMHQMGLADRTAYGLSADQFSALRDEISPAFTGGDSLGWTSVDEICARHGIDVLLYKDTDPIWAYLQVLKTERSPLYENLHYAIFPCGSNALTH